MDVIKSVGIGGNYLAEMHTAKHLRKGTLVPDAARQAVLRRVARRRADDDGRAVQGEEGRAAEDA